MTDRSNPFEEIEQLFDRMSQQFEGTEWPLTAATGPAVDLADHPEAFEVTVDLPGFDKEDVDLRLTDRRLRIEAERETEEAEEGATYLRRERHRESVTRSVSLPEAVDESGVSATLSNGVLTVTLPKAAAGESRSIDIE